MKPEDRHSTGGSSTEHGVPTLAELFCSPGQWPRAWHGRATGWLEEVASLPHALFGRNPATPGNFQEDHATNRLP